MNFFIELVINDIVPYQGDVKLSYQCIFPGTYSPGMHIMPEI